MKRIAIVKALTIGTVTAVALCVAPMASANDKGCSDASLQGDFALKGDGVTISAPPLGGPNADVNTLNFDGNGNVTADTGILNLNGNITPVTEKGTYKVNADCTGTYEVLISPFDFTAHYFFVIVDRNELQVICTDSGVVFTGTARRQFPAGDRRQ